jgi:surface antigen
MLGFDPPVSAYLVQPNLTRRQKHSWGGFASKYFVIKRHNPRPVHSSIIGLLIMSAGVIAISPFFMRHNEGKITSSNEISYRANAGSMVTASSDNSKTFALSGSPVGSASLITAIHATILPTGPTGEKLPPGSMATDRSYPNSYARGQCTWYVASHRQIPSNWGNANAWYYHAISAQWSVGTIPAVAAVAWTPAGAFGHVALVESVSADGRSVYISEMNYRGVGVKSFRWAPANQFKYIY